MKTTSNLSLFLRHLCLLAAAVLFFAALGGAALAQPSPDDPGTDNEDNSALLKECDEQMREAGKLGYANVVKNINDTAGEQTKADQANPIRDARGSINDTYCLARFTDYFGELKKLLAGLESVTDMLSYLAEKLAAQACEYVATELNNVLASACVSIPYPAFDTNLPSAESVTCDGISLNSFLKFDSGSPLNFSSQVDSHFLTNSLSRWIKDNNVSTGSAYYW